MGSTLSSSDDAANNNENETKNTSTDSRQGNNSNNTEKHSSNNDDEASDSPVDVEAPSPPNPPEQPLDVPSSKQSQEATKLSFGFRLKRRRNSVYSVKDYLELHNDESVPWLVKESPQSPWVIQKIKDAIDTENKVLASLATFGACVLTFALTNRGEHIDFNTAAFIVVLLIGSAFPTLATPVAAGAYAGMTSRTVLPNYGWVSLLGVAVAALWQIVVHFKLLVGFSGRLGITAFVATNLTTALSIAAGKTSSDVYGSSNVLWAERLRWQPSVWLVACTTVSTMVVALFRFHSNNPLNPVVAATFTSLLPMLIVVASEYEYSVAIVQGFATGAFAGMASFDRLPTIFAFGTTGLLAGLWSLFFAPFFLGFGGKEGFLALSGYLTYALLVKSTNVLKAFFTHTESRGSIGS